MAIRSASGLTSTPARSPTIPAATSTLRDSAVAYELLPSRARFGVHSSGGSQSLVLGAMRPRTGTTVGKTCGGPGDGQNGERVTIRTRRRQLRSTFVWALCLAALVLSASLFTAVFRETPDYVAAALVSVRVRRSRSRRDAQLAPRKRPFGGTSRSTDGPSEPRAPRRSHRAGLPPLAPLGRAVHADRDRPRRLQGRERRPRPSRRRSRAEVARTALRGDHPRDGHRGSRRRGRVRHPLDGHRERRPGGSPRRPAAQCVAHGRFASTARPWRSTAASAGRCSPTTARPPRSSCPEPTDRCTRRSATRATSRCCCVAASMPASCATSSPRSRRTSWSSSTSRSSTSRAGHRAPPRLSSAACCRTEDSSHRPSSCLTSSARRSSASSRSSSSPTRSTRRSSGRRPGTTSASRSTSRIASSTIRSSPTVSPRCSARSIRPSRRSRSRSSRPGPGAGTQVDEEILGRFDALGVRLSLDDAGRAASFAALRVLPLDELKIDVSFVHGLGKNPTDAALVRGMIDIGHALGLRGRRGGCRDARGVEHRSPSGAATTRRASTSRAHAGPTSSSSGSAPAGPRSPDATRTSRPPGFQSGSSCPPAAFAARARMKRRSESRLR